MWKLASVVALTVSLVAFSMANAHRIQLNYFFGEPAEIRVIVLIGICYLAGALTVVLTQMAKEARERIRVREGRRRRRRLPVLEEER